MGLCKKCPVIYSQPQPCPCGKTSLRPPIVCGTIVPECDNVCEKEMDCRHKCLKMCHYGNCQCMEDVLVKCRCGKEDIKTVCGRETLCLNKCSNLLPCGHKCGIQCHKGSCEEAHKHNPCRKLCEKLRPDCNHVCGQHCHTSKKCA
jgi:transcriptional repressor NF-X1